MFRLFKNFNVHFLTILFHIPIAPNKCVFTSSKNAIFQIGVRDNRGMDYLLETEGDSYQQKRDSERAMIDKFFKIRYSFKLRIFFNSLNFFPFLLFFILTVIALLSMLLLKY